MEAPTLSPESDVATKASAIMTAATAPCYRTQTPVRLKVLCLAVVSGALLWLCHFPVAWGWLGWVALVPLLALVRADISGRWRYLCAWLAATVYFWAAISWMTVADYRMVACWALLSFYCSLYFPLGIFLVRRLERGTGLPLLVTLPTVWTALEFFRSFFGTGFSWYLLAHTQHNMLAVIQIADVGGAFAVSFLVVAVNAIVFEGLTRLAPIRHWLALPATEGNKHWRSFAVQAVLVLMLVGGTLTYGLWRLSYDDLEVGPRIALLQGNVDQRLRIAASRSPEAQAKVRAVYDNLCLDAAQLQPRPELIIWPETSFPVNWVALAPHIDLSIQPLEIQKNLAAEQGPVRMVGQVTQTNVLLGLNTELLDFGKKIYRYNSALLVDANGEAVRRYDKIHRVPFGEYVPLRDWLPFMNSLAPYDFDYSIGCGDGLTRFPLGKYHFGVLVCYEDTDPFMARDYGIATADGPPVDFLVNISNDGWFDGSSEHEEHLAISRFRGIESRRALARSVNMGISAVIDSSGRVIAPLKVTSASQPEVWAIPSAKSGREGLATSQWSAYKQAEGIVVVDVPIDRRTSLYAAWGDWLPNGCWALIGCGLVWSRLRGRKCGTP